MASRGVSIKIDVDPNGAVQGVETVGDAFDKLDKTVGQTSKEADKDLGKVEESLKDVKKEAQATSATFEKSISQPIGRGVDEADVKFQSFKKSAKSAATAATNAFDGSAESLISTGQVAAQNFFSSFGAVGGAAAVAGVGAAFGIINAILAENTKQAEEAKTRIADLTDAMLKTKEIGGVALESVADNVKEIVKSAKEGVPSFDDLKKKTEETGVATDALVLAYAGNEEAIKGIQAAIKERYDTERKAWIKANGDGAESLAQFTAQQTALVGLGQEINKLGEEYGIATEAERQFADTGIQAALDHQEAVQTWKDSINASYDQAALAVEDFRNKETGILDVQAYINSMTARGDALATYQQRLADANLDEETKNWLAGQGADAGAAAMEAWVNATDSQKESLKKAWGIAASEASGVADQNITKILGTAPAVKDVVIEVDSKQAEKDIDKIVQKKTVQVIFDYRDKYGKVVP